MISPDKITGSIADKWLLIPGLLTLFAVGYVISLVVGLSDLRLAAVSQKQQLASRHKSAFEQAQTSHYLRANATEFERLIGQSRPQRRLKWAEVLQVAGTDTGIDVSYEMQATQQISDGKPDSPLEVGYEMLDIELVLAHDNELLRFIHYLQAMSPQTFDITSLNIVRDTNADLPVGAARGSLRVNITVRWYSIEILEDSSAEV